jgi:hypothetical protein
MSNRGDFETWEASRIAAILMLALAAFEMPSAFYSALRMVVAVAASIEIYQVRNREMSKTAQTWWTVAFAAIAVVFNPILPLEMERETWVVFNSGALAVFGIACFGAKLTHNNKPRFQARFALPAFFAASGVCLVVAGAISEIPNAVAIGIVFLLVASGTSWPLLQRSTPPPPQDQHRPRLNLSPLDIAAAVFAVAVLLILLASFVITATTPTKPKETDWQQTLYRLMEAEKPPPH